MVTLVVSHCRYVIIALAIERYVKRHWPYCCYAIGYQLPLRWPLAGYAEGYWSLPLAAGHMSRQ